VRLPLAGHAWTLWTWLAHGLRPRPAPPARSWTASLTDPDVGQVVLTGALREEVGQRDLLLVVHGLGGSIESRYMGAAARAAAGAGVACLRLNLRGADRSGQDIHHAGLTADLEAALASTEVAAYERILILGYSLGGHAALRYGAGPVDPRVAGIAAICPPLDLDLCVRTLDAPPAVLYRLYLLRGLVEVFEAVATRRPMTISVAEARAIRSIREWDDRVVAPRFGFRGATHYYQEASAGPRLPGLAVPALLVLGRHDPMVPADTVEGSLRRTPPCLTVRWLERGGHVGFPQDVDLGVNAPLGLEAQVVGWLRQRPGSGPGPASSGRPTCR
jgi:uncharacterized protein